MELVKIGMIVSLLLVVLFIIVRGFVIAKGKDTVEHWATILTFIVALISVIAFFIGVPIGGTYSETYTQVENCPIIRGESAVVIDLSSSPQKQYGKDAIMFNSYKAVMSINDSTTNFYLYEEKSFYRIRQTYYFVWSNPPYNEFNQN